MELVSEAIAFAVKAHDGMRRKKSGVPYILHPMEASVIVGTMTDDQNLIAAAVLHDVVEDAGITLEEIKEKFGQRVWELVRSETEDKRADLPPASTWRIRKEESLEVLKNTEDIGVLMVWLAISSPICVRSTGIGRWKAMLCGKDLIRRMPRNKLGTTAQLLL